MIHKIDESRYRVTSKRLFYYLITTHFPYKNMPKLKLYRRVGNFIFYISNLNTANIYIRYCTFLVHQYGVVDDLWLK